VLPPLSFKADSVRFFVPPADTRRLILLPWDVPLEEWDKAKVRLIPVKSGLSRDEDFSSTTALS
jgi:hypothetical protein